MGDHFYLTLPSDVASSQYVVKLPEPIRLSDDYELGVSEIVYPHTWYNVNNDDELYWIAAYNVFTNKFLVPKMYVKSGFYKDGETFASSLTHQATRALADVPVVDVKFTFVKHLDRIRMQMRNSIDTTVIMSADLLEFMGFARMMIARKEVDRVGQRPFDVNRGLNLMYVYCDVASHAVVGDTKAPLLRVINPIGKHGEVVRITYDRPHYVPVGRLEFDSVAISINNELGEPLAVRSGQFVTTLHFRRRRR